MLDNRIELIKLTEKLQERCQCFDCNDGADLQEYVEKFLNVLARLFCWVDSDCDTILLGEHQEVVPLTELEQCGCQAIFEFKPYYFKGFDPSTLKLYIRKRQGMSREVYPLDTDKFNWDFIDGTALVDVTDYLNPCCPPCDPCGCGAEYTLLATYEAGYTADTMPNCVLDALCHFMQVFIAYQNDCGSLNDCERMDRLAVGSVLKSKSIDYLIRTWEVDNTSLEVTYTNLIKRWEFETLQTLSLCQYRSSTPFVKLGKDIKC